MSDHDATNTTPLLPDEGQLLTDAQRALVTEAMREKLRTPNLANYYLHHAQGRSDDLAEDIAFSFGAPEGRRYDPELAFLWNESITTTEMYHLALDAAREIEPDYLNPSHIEVCPICRQQSVAQAGASDAETPEEQPEQEPSEEPEEHKLLTLMYSTLTGETLAVVRVYANTQPLPSLGSNAAYATIEIEDPALEQPIRFRKWLRGTGNGWVSAIENLYLQIEVWLNTGPGALFETLFATRPQLVRADAWEGGGPDAEQYRFTAYSDGLSGYLVEVAALSTFNTGVVATPLNDVIGEGSTSDEAHQDAWEKLVEHIEAQGTPLCAHCHNTVVDRKGEVCMSCIEMYGLDLDDDAEPATTEPASESAAD